MVTTIDPIPIWGGAVYVLSDGVTLWHFPPPEDATDEQLAFRRQCTTQLIRAGHRVISGDMQALHTALAQALDEARDEL